MRVLPVLRARSAAVIATVVSGIVCVPTPADAQYKRRFDLDRPAVTPPLLPAVRLGLAVAPTWAECSGTDSACRRLDARGVGLRVEAMAPLDDAIALGGRLTHARFGGTPSTSSVTVVELAAQLHSNFDAAAGVYFGLSYAMMGSPGAPGCSGKPSSGLGVEIGVRARARNRLGLAVFAAAVGSPFRSCSEPSIYRLEPEPADPAAIGGTAMVGLAVSFDVGKYRD